MWPNGIVEARLDVSMSNPTLVARHQIRPRVPLSTSTADNPDLTPMHLIDVACKVVLIDDSGAPGPVALYSLPYNLNNGERQLFIEIS
jgi:hypothetical protein